MERYCSYGAVSQAQLEGCVDHVSVSDVEARDTNAALYARGEIDSCRADAGPFCGQFNACIVHGGYAGEMRALIQFTAWTGLRASEVQALQWADVGESTIWVRRARKDNGSYGKPKTGKEREIAFPIPAQVLDQVPRRGNSPFVFHTPRGRAPQEGTSTTSGTRSGTPRAHPLSASPRASRRSAFTTCVTSAPPSSSKRARPLRGQRAARPRRWRSGGDGPLWASVQGQGT